METIYLMILMMIGLKLSNNNHDTIGGFVLHLLGEIPEENNSEL